MSAFEAPVLVTGAAGHIGANLVRRLVGLGVRPTVLARLTSPKLRLAGLEDRVETIQADLADAHVVREIFERTRPATIFHLASSFFNPPTLTAIEHVRDNVAAMAGLLEAARAFPVRSFVHMGTAAVYPARPGLDEAVPLAPATIYGAAKAAASTLASVHARLHGTPCVELRLFATFGPWERAARLVPSVLIAALEGRPARVGDERPMRDFVYVDDVIDALLAAAEKPVEPGAVYNVCSGRARAVGEVARAVLARLGDPVPLETGSFAPRADEIWEISGLGAAAARDLDWRPRVGFERGLDQTIDWFRANLDVARRLM
jgi:nucleoside-diphosphate-sugar epimerase